MIPDTPVLPDKDPAGANVVNKGFNPLNQTYDIATARVTYVTL